MHQLYYKESVKMLQLYSVLKIIPSFSENDVTQPCTKQNQEVHKVFWQIYILKYHLQFNEFLRV